MGLAQQEGPEGCNWPSIMFPHPNYMAFAQFSKRTSKQMLAHELHDRVCLIVFFVSTPAFTHELHGCAAAWLCCDFFSHQHSLMSCIIVMPLQVKGPKKILNRPLLYSLINRIKVGSGRMVGIIEMGAVGGSGKLQ